MWNLDGDKNKGSEQEGAEQNTRGSRRPLGKNQGIPKRVIWGRDPNSEGKKGNAREETH